MEDNNSPFFHIYICEESEDGPIGPKHNLVS
jgi:hypothetical protein